MVNCLVETPCMFWHNSHKDIRKLKPIKSKNIMVNGT